ncbi:hypothetical protein EUGRSUZ_F02769 [Eucalyptus grandis]|uniref:Uncharacterized protein n=2 Tax=Eucalyptus grandis TaxID=71139 RepID=A0ACC3KJW5_EUCGR|nr:hypothetical protein EUGRSUZ_F02769 [Eucalyptus grandis]
MMVTCLRLLHNHSVGSMTVAPVVRQDASASVSPSLRSFRDQFIDLNTIRSEISGEERLVRSRKPVAHCTSCWSNMHAKNSD